MASSSLDGAAVARTMSLEEVRRSRLLTGIDVVLFFSSGILATLFWLETKGRARELRRHRVETDSLTCRGLFLQLLSASNVLRAVALVVDAQLRMVLGGYGDPNHTLQEAWHRWFDYVLSSLPTLIWSSMLSVLLLYTIEVYHRSQLRQAPLLRPTFIFLNVVAYLLYATFAAVTLHLSGPTYRVFSRSVYFLLGCIHVLLALGMLRYGVGLLWQLRLRTKSPTLQASSSALLIRRVALLAMLVPITETVRTYNDLEYALGRMPFNLGPGAGSLLFLAAAKFGLEWVPSVAILYAFRPSQTHGTVILGTDSPNSVDPLLPLGQGHYEAGISAPSMVLPAPWGKL